MVKQQKPEIREGFKFRGGHVALDLAATLAARLKPSPRELLMQPRDLARWLVAAEITDSLPDVTDADLDRARTLRESIYSVAAARIQGNALPESERRRLNRAAAEASAVPQLAKDGWIRLTGKTQTLLATIARDAIILLGSDLSLGVRQCEGESCALLFLDISRAQDRRWCSMSGCGNKAKVADFRRRQRLNL
jgi:predicted RNA-binding Zn ribbon-like protein